MNGAHPNSPEAQYREAIHRLKLMEDPKWNAIIGWRYAGLSESRRGFQFSARLPGCWQSMTVKDVGEFYWNADAERAYARNPEAFN